MQRILTDAREFIRECDRKDLLQILGLLGFMLLISLLSGYSLKTSLIMMLVTFAGLFVWALRAVAQQNDSAERMAHDESAAAEHYALRLRDEGWTSAMLGMCVVSLIGGYALGFGPSLMIGFVLCGGFIARNLVKEARELTQDGESDLLLAWCRLVATMTAFGAAAAVAGLIVIKLGGLGIVPANYAFGFKPKTVELWILGAMLLAAIWDVNRTLCRKLARSVAEAQGY